MRQNPSRWHVAQRCSCGDALEALFAAVLPNLPQGKLRVETGLAYDVDARRLSSTLAVEGHSYGARSGARSSYGGRAPGGPYGGHAPRRVEGHDARKPAARKPAPRKRRP